MCIEGAQFRGTELLGRQLHGSVRIASPPVQLSSGRLAPEESHREAKGRPKGGRKQTKSDRHECGQIAGQLEEKGGPKRDPNRPNEGTRETNGFS